MAISNGDPAAAAQLHIAEEESKLPAGPIRTAAQSWQDRFFRELVRQLHGRRGG